MLEIGVLIACFLVSIYVWLTWNYDHWKKRNIPYLEPKLIFGNVRDFALMTRNKGLVYDDLYKQGTEPLLGIYNMRQPQWLVRDAALMKVLTSNEFSNFRDNDLYHEPSDFFLDTNVFFYSGEKWKKNRSIITPALTMSKLRLFVPHMIEICKEMIQYVDQQQGKEMDAKSFANLFTIETAMSYVYGVKCNSYQEPMSQYRKVFNEIFDPDSWIKFKFTITSISPSIGHFFKIGFTPKSFTDFYMNVVEQAVDYKKKNPGNRKDFLQFLIDEGAKDGAKELSLYEMTGLTMNLAGDGSETTSVGLNSVLDCLIRYPEQQARLREEIDEKINTLEDINYENINSMPYLSAFIFESLRIFTPIPLLEKKCTNDCEVTFEGRKYSFKRGDRIALPLMSFHKDTRYFDDPNEFRPERFINGSDHLGFSPFGGGPRMCLGRMFAQTQMKVFLCALLKHFVVLPKGDKAPELEFEVGSPFLLVVKGGVWIRLKRR